MFDDKREAEFQVLRAAEEADRRRRAVGKYWIILGVVIGIFLLAFVNSVSLFGRTCYFIGDVSLNSTCFHPIFYFGAWAIAAAAIGFGGLKVFGKEY
jgi:hypothetical protein